MALKLTKSLTRVFCYYAAMKHLISALLVKPALSSAYDETETPSDRIIRENMDKITVMLSDLKDKLLASLPIPSLTNTTVPPVAPGASAADAWVLISGDYTSDHLGVD